MTKKIRSTIAKFANLLIVLTEIDNSGISLRT